MDFLNQNPFEPNPDWVNASCDSDIHLLCNPEVLKKVCVGPMDSSWCDSIPKPIGKVSVEPSKPHSRPIFKKVYKAPGYPTEPRNDKARALDGYINAFAVQPAGAFDYRPLRAWLNDNIN